MGIKSIIAAGSEEGRAVLEMQESIEKIQQLFAEALDDASENFQRAEINTTEDGGVKMQTRSVNGEQVVWIEGNVLKENKGLPVHQFIANYIAEHIGEVYTIIESGQKVYIGEDLPGEYTQSKYTQTIFKSNPSITRAKNRASANLGEMIEIASNRRWEKTKHTQSKDAKYGMYRYDTQFGFPVKNSKGDVIGANIYDAEILIRNASDGKKYLYDIVSIKKNTANSEWLTQRVTSAAGKPAGQKGDVSKNSIRNSELEVKNESTEAMDLDVDEKTESVSPAVMKSERTWTESDYVQELDAAAKEIAKAIGVTAQKAKDYIDSVNSIPNYIEKTVDKGRIMHIKNRISSDTLASLQLAGNISKETLKKNVAQFNKKVKEFKEQNRIYYSTQETDNITARDLLANALESAAKNKTEQKRLSEYKAKIDTINAEEQRLREIRSEIKKLSSAKGERDTKKISEVRSTEKDILTYLAVRTFRCGSSTAHRR